MSCDLVASRHVVSWLVHMNPFVVDVKDQAPSGNTVSAFSHFLRGKVRVIRIDGSGGSPGYFVLPGYCNKNDFNYYTSEQRAP